MNRRQELRPIAGVRQCFECVRGASGYKRLPFERQNAFVEPRRLLWIAGKYLVPIVGIQDRAVPRRAHVECEGPGTAADANLVVNSFQRQPLIVEKVSLPRSIEAFDEKILHVGAGVRQPPADTIVVTDDHERDAGNRHTLDIHR